MKIEGKVTTFSKRGTLSANFGDSAFFSGVRKQNKRMYKEELLILNCAPNSSTLFKTIRDLPKVRSLLYLNILS